MKIKEFLVGKHGGNVDTKYAVYRIPTMTFTAKGTLLACFEARMDANDNGVMDILLFRSTDGGESFSEPIIIVGGADKGVTANNPAFIVEGDRIHFLYCMNYGVCNKCVDAARSECEHHGGGGVYYCYSDDDGLTWSEPRNISDSADPDKRYMIATGPCAGLVNKEGALVCPVWLVLKSSDGADPENPLQQSPNDVSALYSLDSGKTWQMGEVIPKDRSEVDSAMEGIIAPLSDGRIMYNVRSFDSYRSVSVSDNGYSGFSKLTFDKSLKDPGCHAGLTAYDTADGRHVLLFVNCEMNGEEHFLKMRKNLVLKASLDDGKTWTHRVVIESGDAGYSSIAVDKEGTVYVIYEVKAGQKEMLARLDIKEILE